uniref:Uncharacterized protein n=1 Tax=Arundo donax TaxID=35708 RepID=A0A0A9B6C8_ARUDO
MRCYGSILFLNRVILVVK